MRSLAEKRHNDWKKAIRKRDIVRDVYRFDRDWYDNLHQYSKNKIFCSCPMCACKSTGRLAKRLAGPAENWSIADKRKQQSAAEQIEEFENECETNTDSD